MSVKPIRLFGDPVLRTPADPVVDFDKELRKLVKDLTDTMLDAPGAGLAAPQIGVGLRVFTYYVDDELGHLINPDLDLSDERARTARRAACRSPACASTAAARLRRRGQGLQHVRRAGHARGHRAAGPLHPARDRPPGRRPVHRPAGRRAAQAGDEGDPRGRVGGLRRRPTVKVSPARHARARRSDGCALVFAGTPAAGACRRCDALLASAARGRRRRHPARRPGRPRPQAAADPRSPSWPSEAGIEVLSPRRPRDPEFLDRLRELAPDCCPVVAYGALLPQRGARHPAARLGQPALLAAARLARRRAGAARRSCTATRSPAPRTFQLEAGLDTGPVFGVVTEPIRPADTAGDLLGRLAEPAPGCWSPPWTGSRTATLRAGAAAGRGRHRSRPKIDRRRRPGRLVAAGRSRSTG